MYQVKTTLHFLEFDSNPGLHVSVPQVYWMRLVRNIRKTECGITEGLASLGVYAECVCLVIP